jgi:hypothetical protein
LLNSILGQCKIADLAVRTLEESADVLINDWTTGGVMTIIQAAGLRVKGKQRVDPPQGEHLNLELEGNENGHSRGNYNCIVFGESVVHKHQ